MTDLRMSQQNIRETSKNKRKQKNIQQNTWTCFNVDIYLFEPFFLKPTFKLHLSNNKATTTTATVTSKTT